MAENTANIAVIGWGSLIWCPGSLSIKTKWKKDGPSLSIEFARVSDDGRLTLVIHPGCAPQQTYWAVSEFSELDAARQNLQGREGCSLNNICFFPVGDDKFPIPQSIATELEAWLKRHKDVGALIWTGLTSNWSKKFARKYSVVEAIRYLEKLEAERKEARLRYQRAREYFMNAPPLIQTEVRRRMREKGWTDAKLSDFLFET